MNLAPARTRSYPPGGYEEYHPYGSTAWWAGSSATVSQKRYRFTGMERDDETGLQCHGVRYYATWLGRWVSADPIGLGDGVNRFCYVAGNPCGSVDGSGLQAMEPTPEGPENSEDPSAYATFAEYAAAATSPHSESGLRRNWEEARIANGPAITNERPDFYRDHMNIAAAKITPRQYQIRWGNGVLDNKAYRLWYTAATVARGVAGNATGDHTDVSYEAAELLSDAVLTFGPIKLARLEAALAPKVPLAKWDLSLPDPYPGLSLADAPPLPRPPNMGFASQEAAVLKEGTLLGRFGRPGPTSNFLTLAGEPETSLSLPPGTAGMPYQLYRVTTMLRVQAGPAAAWYGQGGGGLQFVSRRPITELVAEGILEPVPMIGGHP